MFLAYVDDAGTGDKGKPFQLMTGVVITDRWFRDTEIFAVGVLDALIPKEKAEEFWATFQEFKAWQLYGGHGPFEGIEQNVRFKIIESLLGLVRHGSFPVIFGGLNKAEFQRQNYIYGSANPMDVCFRICIQGVSDFVQHNWPTGFALLIADDSTQDKKALRSAFYDYRERLRPTKSESAFPYLHDDMYFGDSRYSIGIQIADLCGYFIAKHLENYVQTEGFYNIFKDQLMYSRIEPGNLIIHPKH